MSKTTAKPQTVTTDESRVIDYLQKNPELLMSYPQIFSDITIPHHTGGVTSLVERQLKILRDENQKLKKNTDELVSIARENEELNQRFHRLALELICTEHLHDVLAMVQEQVQTFFYTDYVCFKFLPGVAPANAKLDAHYLDQNPELLEQITPWLANRKPVCGQLDAPTNLALFGNQISVASSAIIPLYHTADIGLLCLGSVSPDRFNNHMGTIFLQHLGELVSTRLQGLLVVQ